MIDVRARAPRRRSARPATCASSTRGTSSGCTGAATARALQAALQTAPTLEAARALLDGAPTRGRVCLNRRARPRRVCRVPARLPETSGGIRGFRIRGRLIGARGVVVAVVQLLAAGRRRARGRAGAAVRHQRLRRLPQHPAAGDQRPGQRAAAGAFEAAKHAPAAQRRPAADVLEPDDRGAEHHRLADRRLLQGRDVRRAGRRRRHEREPRARRHDRARQAVRRAAHLRRHARRADVRDRLRDRPRTGCSSSTCCATPGEGDLAQFAGGANVVDGRERLGERALHPAGPRQPGQLRAARTSPTGRRSCADATNYVAGINAYIAKAQNPLFTALTMMPAEYAALGQRPGRSRSRSRTSSRSRRSSAGSSATAAASSCPTRSCTKRLKQQFGPERRSVAGSPEAAGRKRWRGLRAEVQGHLGLRHVPELRRPVRSRGADDGARQVVPVPDAAGAEQGARSRVALPDPGSVQYVNHVVAGSLPAGQSDGSSGSAGPGNTGSGGSAARRAAPVGPAGRPGPAGTGRHDRRWPVGGSAACPTRCWSAPRTAPAAIRWP